MAATSLESTSEIPTAPGLCSVCIRNWLRGMSVLSEVSRQCQTGGQSIWWRSGWRNRPRWTSWSSTKGSTKPCPGEKHPHAQDRLSSGRKAVLQVRPGGPGEHQAEHEPAMHFCSKEGQLHGRLHWQEWWHDYFPVLCNRETTAEVLYPFLASAVQQEHWQPGASLAESHHEAGARAVGGEAERTVDVQPKGERVRGRPAVWKYRTRLLELYAVRRQQTQAETWEILTHLRKTFCDCATLPLSLASLLGNQSLLLGTSQL